MSVSVPENITDISDIHTYIAETVQNDYKGVVRHFLLQCAHWEESRYTPNTWKAMIECVHDFIYALDDDDIKFASTTDLCISSWKGNHPNINITIPPVGTLYNYSPYVANFKGTIWTRGE